MKKWLKFFGTPLLAALLALFPFASCSNSSGGTPMIVPDNTSQAGGGTSSGGTQTGGTTQGGGGSSGGSGEQQQDQADQFGGKPYDVTIGNGGYNLHTFMGANTTFDSKEKADYYIGEAETYVKGLANQLSESTKNRPAAQAYFQNLFDEIQSIYYGPAHNDGTHFTTDIDGVINGTSRGVAQVMGDITKNTANEYQAYAFEICYRTIANEALKAGAGNAFDGSDSASRYNTEKNNMTESAGDLNIKSRLNIDLPKAYENNDFTDVTNYIDTVLTTAATKIGHNVTADDLRKVVNIAMTTKSLEAMHERSKNALNHKDAKCTLDTGIIEDAINPVHYTYAMLNKQDNGIELC